MDTKFQDCNINFCMESNIVGQFFSEQTYPRALHSRLQINAEFKS